MAKQHQKTEGRNPMDRTITASPRKHPRPPVPPQNRHRLVVGVLALLGIVLWAWGAIVLPSPVQAQDKEIVIEQRDCEITIRPDGDVEVIETWKVQFHTGRFSRVMHDISHDQITGITGWEVREPGKPYQEDPNLDAINYEPQTYTVRTDEQHTTITWYFPKTQNRSRLFTLKYTLQDAIQVYPEGRDQFSWQVVEHNHAYPILNSQVVVHVPETVDPTSVQAASYRNQQPEDTQPEVAEDGTVTFTGGPFDPRSSWLVRVDFPHAAEQADRPPWQTAAEHAFADPTNAATVLRRDYDLTVAPSAALHVVETWELDLSGGPFSNASFSLPHTHLVSIEGWSVSESGTDYAQEHSQEPHTFAVDTDSEATQLSWFFPLTTDQTRRFTIGYTVVGGLWIDPDGDQISWTLHDPNRPFVAQSSQATVHLPAPVDTDRVQATMMGEPGTEDVSITKEVGSVTVSAGPFEPDSKSILQVTFPHGNVKGSPAPWQLAVEAEQQEEVQADRQQSLSRLLGMIVAGVAVVVILVGVVRFWSRLPK